jgi:hypothetical protein
VLRISGPRRDEVRGGWRWQHNEELHNLYSSPSSIRMTKSKRMSSAGNVAQMEKEKCYRLLVGRQEGKRPLGRPRYRRVDNIRWNLERFEGIVWTGLA